MDLHPSHFVYLGLTPLDDTRTRLAAEHPDLPIFVTMTAVDLRDGWTDAPHAARLEAAADIMSFSDYLALSLYPFMSAYLTNPVPETAFDDLQALANGRPMAIAPPDAHDGAETARRSLLHRTRARHSNLEAWGSLRGRLCSSCSAVATSRAALATTR